MGSSRQKYIYLFVLVFAMLAVFPVPAIASAGQEVTVHNAETVAQNPELNTAMAKLNWTPKEFASDSPLDTFTKEAGAMLRKLLVEADGPGKIHFVLIDDMRMNATFSRLPNGDRLVTVNVGLIPFLESDDALAFILSHELEHGSSTLQLEVDALKKTRDALDDALARSLQRAVENEVDVKGMLRAHRAGYNPHAGYHTLAKMERSGHGGGRSHTTSSSRKHVVGMGSTAISRVLGEKTKPDEPGAYTKALLEPAQRFIAAESFSSAQKEKLARFLREDRQAFKAASEIYENIKSNSGYWGGYENSHVYFLEHLRLSGALDKMGNGILSEEEKANFLIEVHVHLDRQFENARKAVLGEQYLPPDVATYQKLRDFDRRTYNLINTDPFSLNRNIQGKKALIERYREALAKETNPESANELRSTLEAETKQLTSMEARMRNLRYYYKPGELDALLAKYPDPPADGIQQDLRIQEATSKQKVVSDLAARNDARLKQTAADMREKIFISLLAGKNPATDLPFFIDINTPEGLEQRRNRALAALPEIYDSMVSRALEKKNEGFRNLVGLINNDAYFGHQFIHLIQVRKNPADQKKIDSASKGLLQRLAKEVSNQEEMFHLVHILDRVSDWPFQAQRQTDFKAYARQIHGFANQIRSKATRIAEQAAAEAKTSEEIFSLALSFGQQVDKFDRFGLLEGAEKSKIVKALSSRLAVLLREAGISSTTQKSAEALVLIGRESLWPQMADKSEFIQSRLKDLQPLFEEIAKAPAPDELQKKLKISFPSLMASVDSYLPRDDFFSFIYSLRKKGLVQGVASGFRSLDYSHWVEKMHPEDFHEQVSALSAYEKGQDRLNEITKNFLKKKTPLVGEAGAVREAMQVLQHSELHLPEALRALAPEHFPARMRYINMLLKTGLQLAAEEQKLDPILPAAKRNLIAREGAQKYLGKYNSVASPQDIKSHTLVEWARVDPGLIAEYFTHHVAVEGKSIKTDSLFELFWKLTEGRPEMRQILADEGYVGYLMADFNKKRLADWQLEQKFRISDLKTKYARRERNPPKTGIRAELEQVLESIEKQFPGESSAKNTVLEKVEKAFLTNEEETKEIGALKTTMENWHKQRKLALIDSPDALQQYIETNHDRLEFVKYLIGYRAEPPPFLTAAAQQARIDEHQFEFLRRNFTESSIEMRTFLLQPLLDADSGIWSEAGTKEELIRFLLGDNSDHALIRKVFLSYLDAVPESERMVILGNILGSFADSKEKRFGLKAVVEALGPFGIKAGQFMRTSGLLPEHVRAELNDVFDNALPPNRQEIFKHLKDVFGDALPSVEHVRQVLGSGSINYTVLLDLIDPDTHQIKRVVAQVKKPNVEGKLFNENENWKRAIDNLLKDKDPTAARMGELLHEAREHTYSTLGPNGAEMDHHIQRNAFPPIRDSYTHVAENAGEISVRVAAPETKLQNLLVGQRFQDSVSLYEFVDNKRLDELEPVVRERYARRIARSELKALLTNGVYDPDGHPGNWLIDRQTGELVRIDYAQKTSIPQQKLVNLRVALAALLRPDADAKMERDLWNNLSSLFVLQEKPAYLKIALKEALRHPKLPSYNEPQDRLFFLRDHLDQAIEAHGQTRTHLRIDPSTRTALASIGRVKVFEEHLAGGGEMGKRTFGRLLLEELGVLPQHTALHLKKQVRSAIVSGIRRCSELFHGFAQSH